MPEPVKVLVLEDRIEDLELVLRCLRKGGLDCDTCRVETVVEFTAALDGFRPDLILSDYTLPGFDGRDALRIARERRPDAPYIFVSGTIGEERAIDALRQGATDYVFKDNLSRLVPAIRRAMDEARERDSRRHAQRELARSEERFRSIAAAAQEWIWETDADGVIRFCSPAVEAILGHAPEELIGSRYFDLVADGTAGALEDSLRAEANSGRTWRDLEMQLEHKDGGLRWLDVSAMPIVDPQGAVVGFRGLSRDVTERRRHERHIARLCRIQAVLTGINSTIVRVHDREELFREACRIAVQEGGFKLAWIGQARPGTFRPDPLVWEGHDDGYLAAAARILDEADGQIGMVGQALKYKRTIVANDIAGNDQLLFQKIALAHGFRSQIALPLLIGKEAAGVLVLYAGEPGFFDHDELKLLRDLAGDISFALDYIGKDERLAYISYYDPPTGLANRQLFFDRLGHAVQAANAARDSFALTVLELQKLKEINDTLGRSAADRVLKEFAGRLKRVFDSSATIARIGGDRFAIVGGHPEDTGIARWIDDHIIATLAEPFLIDGIELRTTFKGGIAFYPDDAVSPEALFANAEAALRRAKNSSARHLFYSPEMNARAAERLHLESRLRKAVEERRFEVHYQPKVNLATREVRGLEALLRWNDTPGVSTIECISLLEETGLIIDVGRWVIEQAVRDSLAWHERGLVVPRVAVNVSEVQLRQIDFVAAVRAALGPETGRIAQIDLEITESLFAENMTANLSKLSLLRAAGMRIYLDDFGTGYSGLSQIAQLPLDALKIDRAFVAGMAGSGEHAAIVAMIVNLARALGIGVVAEGVETESQAARLLGLGCDEAQGYLFGRAVPAEEIAARLERSTRDRH
ncbi:MAG: EAL domain-containing protein [Gammaproteobacteria bacterium]|nr:EAL domain-containing protein [Gammaproteobacteria bacterium]